MAQVRDDLAPEPVDGVAAGFATFASTRCARCAQALAAAAAWRPEVALPDIGMPGLAGHGVAERMRTDEDTARLRLAALTGWGQTADRERAFASGFDAHFTKPVDLDELSRCIAQVARRRLASGERRGAWSPRGYSTGGTSTSAKRPTAVRW